MRRALPLRCLTAALLLIAGLALSGEPATPPTPPLPDFRAANAWNSAAIGTAILIEQTDDGAEKPARLRTTLTDRTDDTYTLVQERQLEDGSFGGAMTLILPWQPDWAAAERRVADTLEIDGRPVDTVKFETIRDMGTHKEIDTHWWSDEFGMEIQTKIEGGTYSMLQKAVKLGEDVAVGNAVFSCVRLESRLSLKNGEDAGTLWLCAKAPGLEVKSERTLKQNDLELKSATRLVEIGLPK